MAKNTNPLPGVDVTDTTLVSLLGVALFTIMAGFSEGMGKMMVVIMWGIVLGWMLLHVSDLQTMVKAL